MQMQFKICVTSGTDMFKSIDLSVTEAWRCSAHTDLAIQANRGKESPVKNELALATQQYLHLIRESNAATVNTHQV